VEGGRAVTAIKLAMFAVFFVASLSVTIAVSALVVDTLIGACRGRDDEP
jgi:hypothetical protein